MSEPDFDELSRRADCGELEPIEGTELRGEEADADTLRILQEVTGLKTWEEIATIALGRPKVGNERGESPAVRTRVPQITKDTLAHIAKTEQTTESKIVRQAIDEYIVNHFKR